MHQQTKCNGANKYGIQTNVNNNNKTGNSKTHTGLVAFYTCTHELHAFYILNWLCSHVEIAIQNRFERKQGFWFWCGQIGFMLLLQSNAKQVLYIEKNILSRHLWTIWNKGNRILIYMPKNKCINYVLCVETITLRICLNIRYLNAFKDIWEITFHSDIRRWMN